MAKGPLAVRWGEWTLDDPHAGAVGRARVELENAGTVAWRDGIRARLPLARRPRQPDRLGRRAHAAARARARRGATRCPPCAPRSRPAATASRDGVAERAVLPLGSDPRVECRPGRADAERPRGSSRLRTRRRIAAAHAEGYAVVAGASEGRRAPQPRVGAALPVGARRARAGRLRTCRGSCARLRRPPADDAWLYDGRIVLEAPLKRRAAGP